MLKFKKIEDEMAELHKDVFYFSLSKVQDEEAAGDIAQNVMEKALLHMDSLKKRSSLKAWVMQITVNEIRLYYRSLAQYRSLFYAAEETHTEEQKNELQIINSMEADILENLVTKEQKLNLMEAMAGLDEKYQSVIQMKALNEMSLVKAAEVLGINVNTARTRYARGLKLLKEAYIRLEQGGEMV